MSSYGAWPVHPQPFEGESVTSWLKGQAEGTFMSCRAFMGACLGEGEWRRRDLDLLDDERLAILASGGRVVGGVETLKQMGLNHFEHLFAPKSRQISEDGSPRSGLPSTAPSASPITKSNISVSAGDFILSPYAIATKHP